MENNNLEDEVVIDVEAIEKKVSINSIPDKKSKSPNNPSRFYKLKLGLIIALCSVFAFVYILGLTFLTYKVFKYTNGVTVRVQNGNGTISREYYDNRNGVMNPSGQDATDGVMPEQSEIAQNANNDAGQQENGATQESIGTGADVVINSVQTIDENDAPIAVVTDVTEVVRAAMPCVVAITNQYSSYDSWYGQMVDDEACGSGIIVSQTDTELLIVTNYHVIEDNNTLYITFIDDSEAEAYVKGYSETDDLAIVSVSLSDLSEETAGAIAIAVLGDSDALQVGEPAIAIGNSLGYGQSVTTGVISALNRNINDSYLIQTDAAINPGNSGGALLNIRGEVIGINSSKIADYVIEGMGYAIPISTARPVIEELMLNETKIKVNEGNRGFLGISGTDVTDDAANRYGMPSGVYVVDVIEGSAAANAGIEKGDIITTLDGQTVSSMTQLQGMLEYYEAGTEVEVIVMRQSNGDYSTVALTVTLGKRDE